MANDSLIDLFLTRRVVQEQQLDAVAARDQQAISTAVVNQAIDRDTTLEAQAVVDQSRAVNRESRLEQLELIAAEEDTVRIAQEAIALSDSQNPLDKVKLWFLQQSDPRYAREGNLERLNYLRVARDSVAARGLLAQEAAAERLTALEQARAIAKTIPTQELELKALEAEAGANRLAALNDLINNKINAINAEIQLKNTELSQLPRDVLEKTLKEAQQAGNGMTALPSGIQVNTDELLERVNTLKQRDIDTTLMRDALARTKLFSLPDTELQTMLVRAQNGFTTYPDGESVSSYLVQEVLANKSAANAQYTLALENERAALDATKMRIVDSMTLEEVTQALNNNGRFDGLEIPIDALQAKASRLAEQAAFQGQLLQRQVVATQPEVIIGQGSAFIESYLANPLLSPTLRNTLTQQRDALLGSVALFPEDADNAYKNEIAQSLVRNAATAAETAIEAEAMALANGDEKIAALHSARLRGQPLPMSAIQELFIDAMQGNGSIGAWLPVNESSVFINTYMGVMNDAQYVMLDNNAKEALAFTNAMQAIKQRANEAYAPVIMALQLSANVNNPLEGKISPETLLSLFDQADAIGKDNYLKRTGASGEGTYELAVEQMVEFLSLLNAEVPNGSRSLVDWWASEARNRFVAQAAKGIVSQASTDPANYVLASIAASELPTQLPAISRVLNDAQRVIDAGALEDKRRMFLEFGGDQGKRQIFLLQSDRKLTDQERRVAMYQVFMPILESLDLSNATVKEQNDLIEEALLNFQTDDRTVRRVVNKVLSGRAEALQRLRDFDDLAGFQLFGPILRREPIELPYQYEWSK